MKKAKQNHLYSHEYYTTEEASRLPQFPIKGENLKQYLLEQKLDEKKGLSTLRWRLTNTGSVDCWEIEWESNKVNNEDVS